jgi:hypothetical protein
MSITKPITKLINKEELDYIALSAYQLVLITKI